jgi:predicted PurR-regulated permease PerM
VSEQSQTVPAAAAAPAPPRKDPMAGAPPWVMPMVRRATWRVVTVLLTVAVLLTAVDRARGLVSMLIMALFFGLAMDPGVTWLHKRHGWRRGAATGAIFVGIVVFVAVMVLVLIPAMVQVATRISDQLPGWLDSIQDGLGITIGDGDHADAAAELQQALENWAQTSWKEILGLASGAVGLIFQFFTIAMFTFYFAADAPKIRSSVLRRFTPERQQRLGWALDTAVEQTGGYFYSRLLLMIINGGLFFFVMLLVGVPWLIALPLAVFEGFVAEFIPAIGTYLGAAVPIVLTLGLQGFVPALVLLVWTIVYQQAENYWLSPKISARTMEINGGVAFASALAGGAVAGPMGAFMALPVAAWVTSFLKHYGTSYPLVYHSSYDDGEPEPQAPAEAAAAHPEGDQR